MKKHREYIRIFEILMIALYSLALIFIIVLVSLKFYYPSLIVSIGTLLSVFIPISIIGIIHPEKNDGLKKHIFFSFLRLITMFTAIVLTCVLYAFVPLIKENVNIGFLFFTPIFASIQYIIIRVFSLLLSKDEENTQNTSNSMNSIHLEEHEKDDFDDEEFHEDEEDDLKL